MSLIGDGNTNKKVDVKLPKTDQGGPAKQVKADELFVGGSTGGGQTVDTTRIDVPVAVAPTDRSTIAQPVVVEKPKPNPVVDPTPAHLDTTTVAKDTAAPAKPTRAGFDSLGTPLSTEPVTPASAPASVVVPETTTSAVVTDQMFVTDAEPNWLDAANAVADEELKNTPVMLQGALRSSIIQREFEKRQKKKTETAAKNEERYQKRTAADPFTPGTPETIEQHRAATAPKPNAPFNISSYEKGLGYLLSNFAKMPVIFRGKKYPSSEAAYQANKESLDDRSVYELMVEVITAKLEQHPNLVKQITERGGDEFLATATHNLIKKNGTWIKKNDRWVSTGKDIFMKALRKAYANVTQDTEAESEERAVDEVEAEAETPSRHIRTEQKDQFDVDEDAAALEDMSFDNDGEAQADGMATDARHEDEAVMAMQADAEEARLRELAAEAEEVRSLDDQTLKAGYGSLFLNDMGSDEADAEQERLQQVYGEEMKRRGLSANNGANFWNRMMGYPTVDDGEAWADGMSTDARHEDEAVMAMQADAEAARLREAMEEAESEQMLADGEPVWAGATNAELMAINSTPWQNTTEEQDATLVEAFREGWRPKERAQLLQEVADLHGLTAEEVAEMDEDETDAVFASWEVAVGFSVDEWLQQNRDIREGRMVDPALVAVEGGLNQELYEAAQADRDIHRIYEGLVQEEVVEAAQTEAEADNQAVDEQTRAQDDYRQFEDQFFGDAGDGGTPPPTDGGDGTDATADDDADDNGYIPASKTMARIIEVRTRIAAAIKRGTFRLTGDTAILDKDGKPTGDVEHSAEVYKAIAGFLNEMGRGASFENERFVFMAVMIYRGIAIDRHGKIFNKTTTGDGIADLEFIATVQEMQANLVKYGYPFAYSNPYKKWMGSFRFPTVAPREFAEWFVTNDQGEMAEMDAVDDFIAHNISEWENKVLPQIHNVAPYKQEVSLLDMVDAVADDLGVDDFKSRSPIHIIGAAELFDPMSEAAIFVQDGDTSRLMVRSKADEEYILRVWERMNKGRDRGDLSPEEAIKDPEGLANNVMTKGPKNGMARFFRGLRSWFTAAGIVFHPVLGAASAVEKSIGVGFQSGGLLAMRMLYGLNGKDSGATEETLNMFDEEPALVTAVTEWLKLQSIKGTDGVADAAARGVGMVRGSSRREQDLDNTGKLLTALETLEEVGINTATADWMWRKTTAKIFIQYLVFTLQRNHMNSVKRAEKHDRLVAAGKLDPRISPRPAVEPKITPLQIQEALKNNQDEFFSTFLQRPAGIEALKVASRTSMSGLDSATELIRKAMSGNISSFIVGFSLSWYVRFPAAAIVRITPYSYSMMYTMKRLGNIGLHATDEQTRDRMLTEIGADQDFWEGLRENLVFDSVRFGTQFATYMILSCLVHMFGGFGPPDDDDGKDSKGHLWYEYRINGLELSARPNWFWNETIGFAMPLMVGISEYKRTGDVERCKRIIEYGVFSVLQENKFGGIGLLDFLTDWKGEMSRAQAQAEGMSVSPLSDAEWFAVAGETWFLRRLAASVEPGVVRLIVGEHGIFRGEPDLARSSNKIANPDSEEAKIRPFVMTQYADSLFRKQGQRSPLVGFLLNMQAGLFAPNNSRTQTGYQRNEQPVVTIADPVQQWWVERLSKRDNLGNLSDPANWEEKERQQIANETRSLIALYPTPAQLAAQGVVIPMPARKLLDQYLESQIRDAKEVYSYRMGTDEWATGNGYTFNENRARQNAAKVEKDRLVAKLTKEQDYLWDPAIPYSAAKYNRQETTFRPLYTYKDGERAGQIADPLDIMLHPNSIAVEMYASGDHKSGMLPVVTVDGDMKKGYDFQTPSVWQVPGVTDPKFLIDRYKGEDTPEGMFEGGDLYAGISGDGHIGPGSPIGVPWDNGQWVVGHNSRGLIPEKGPLVKADRTTENDLDLWRGDLGERQYPKDDWKKASGGGGGGGRRYYGGGGGGSYSPKIYAHDAYSLNADKASTLYTKFPSFTRFDFLRPKVMTKGSREAYRREDF